MESTGPPFKMLSVVEHGDTLHERASNDRRVRRRAAGAR
jgi:hypothetical protein